MEFPTFFPTYYVVIIKRTARGYEKVYKRKVRKTDREVHFNSGRYFLDFNEVAYTDKNKHFLYKDYDSGDSCAFHKGDLSIDPVDADTLNAHGLVKAAMNLLGANIGLVTLLLGCGLCLVVGFMVGQNLPAIIASTQGQTQNAAAKLIMLFAR